MKRFLPLLAATVAGLALSLPVLAQTVLTSGPVQIGIRDKGALIHDDIGLRLTGAGEAVAVGWWHEEWGVSANGVVAGDSLSPAFWLGNLNLVSFTSTPTSATSVVSINTLPSLVIVHHFLPAVSSTMGALFQVQVSLANTSVMGTLTDLRYVRVVDFDVPPTPFSEYITIGGLPASNVHLVHNNGFDTANPLASTTPLGSFPPNTNVTDWGPRDQGAYFLLKFGDLAPGAVKRFSMFYGAAYDEVTAMSMLTSVGAEVYAIAQPDGAPRGNSFILAFKGVGGTPLGGA
ncbi:MAG: hypothetical protein RMM08_04035, partial [Armatimonadota bacterium]|nr:hypothetical protein [bacterium]MDW8320513.1 hypothetical protein [Armatimonadota bacterium]